MEHLEKQFNSTLSHQWSLFQPQNSQLQSPQQQVHQQSGWNNNNGLFEQTSNLFCNPKDFQTNNLFCTSNANANNNLLNNSSTNNKIFSNGINNNSNTINLFSNNNQSNPFGSSNNISNHSVNQQQQYQQQQQQNQYQQQQFSQEQFIEQQQEERNEEMSEDQLEEKQILKQYISQLVAKRYNAQSSKKRKELLNQHRLKIIQDTADDMFQNDEQNYFTDVELEYHLSLNIDKLIRDHEEEERIKLELEEQLTIAEQEYFQRQMAWLKEQTCEDNDSQEEDEEEQLQQKQVNQLDGHHQQYKLCDQISIMSSQQ